MTGHVTLFLCGDVMTGRGIDQILPYPGDPTLHEPSIRDAADYVKLAERFTGAIPHPCQFDYIWGDALKHLRQEAPQAIITNLETAITRSESHWPSKDVHYKMSPENIACLTEAKFDCCVLANNHMLDWGIPGLLDTLKALDNAGIKHVGAGRKLREAQEPAILSAGVDSRVIVFSLGSTSSGIPIAWSAEEDRPGLYVIETQRNDPIRTLAQQIDKIKRPGDIVIVSIHWGGNWGYKIPGKQKEFAHRLVDEARVDILHGHSSHHVKAIEVYNERLILYGCGDFLNDYEGITGYESFRGDLGLMYFAEVEPRSGKLHGLRMIPTQVRRFRVNHATAADSNWLEALLNREGKRFGTAVQRSAENFMTLDWS
jgi:poly-gamma-glutamate capsule biosynthesis protein CapA/YwtB (metallophosphatase superfamily)